MEIKIGARVIKNSRYHVPLDKQGKIHTVLSEPWEVGGTAVVKISGEAAGYALDGLTPVDDSLAWVSVKDGLPDKSGLYCAVFKTGGIRRSGVLEYREWTRTWHRENALPSNRLRVTRWMPLPEPPAE